MLLVIIYCLWKVLWLEMGRAQGCNSLHCDDMQSGVHRPGCVFTHIFLCPFSVLSCLHKRFAQGRYYTNAGSTVVAVNPFTDVSHLYSREQIHAYHSRQQVTWLPLCVQISHWRKEKIPDLHYDVNRDVSFNSKIQYSWMKKWFSDCCADFEAL